MNNDDLNTFASIFKNRNPLSIHGYLADTLSNILSFVFMSLLFLVVYGVIKFELDFNLELLGFDDQELANIIDELQEDEFQPKEDSYNSVFNIVVNCTDEGHQEKVFNELQQKGYECQVQSL